MPTFQKPSSLLITAVATALLLAAASASAGSADDAINAPVLNDADTVLDMAHLFGGYNVYAPSVVAYKGMYFLYYSGWQTKRDVPHDRIYMRSSFDNRNWSAPVTVLRADEIPRAFHVGDPSVTVHFNEVGRNWQWTMFFTVCEDPCNDEVAQWHNQIWSAVSNDGIHWDHPRPLLITGLGAAEPSIILEPGPDNTFWKVYYVERLDAQVVKMARVDGNRDLIDVKEVFQHLATGTEAISGVEVAFLAGKWHLFYNVFFGTPLGRVDIYKTESFENDRFPEHHNVLIYNGGQHFCATTTPGVLPAGADEYYLYFGLVPRAANGRCHLVNSGDIHRWRWQD
jgi:hypothetical protein